MKKVILGLLLVVSSVIFYSSKDFSIKAESTNNTTKEIFAKALDDHECNTNEWHFVITNIENRDWAPGFITVYWDNALSEIVTLEKYTGKTGHYTTYIYLGNNVTQAKATIYDNWDGQFNLSHGPCFGTTPTPTPTCTPSPTATPTPSPSPTPTVTTIPSPTTTLTPTPTEEEPTPTPETTSTPTPTPTEKEPTPTPEATSTPTPTTTPVPTSTPKPTATSTPGPTSTPTPKPTSTPAPEVAGVTDEEVTSDGEVLGAAIGYADTGNTIENFMAISTVLSFTATGFSWKKWRRQ